MVLYIYETLIDVTAVTQKHKEIFLFTFCDTDNNFCLMLALAFKYNYKIT